MESNYEKLVKALRYRGNFAEREGCAESCEYFNDMDCPNRIMSDAAAAIEELQALLKEADKKQAYQHDCICELTAENEEHKAEIETLQAEVAFYKKRVCELCGTCPDDMSDPNNCEIAGHGMWVGVNPLVDSVQCSICGGMLYSKELETPYCPYCGAKMEVQDGK